MRAQPRTTITETSNCCRKGNSSHGLMALGFWSATRWPAALFGTSIPIRQRDPESRARCGRAPRICDLGPWRRAPGEPSILPPRPESSRVHGAETDTICPVNSQAFFRSLGQPRGTATPSVRYGISGVVESGVRGRSRLRSQIQSRRLGRRVGSQKALPMTSVGPSRICPWFRGHLRCPLLTPIHLDDRC
jgi:hypothetical protein